MIVELTNDFTTQMLNKNAVIGVLQEQVERTKQVTEQYTQLVKVLQQYIMFFFIISHHLQYLTCIWSGYFYYLMIVLGNTIKILNTLSQNSPLRRSILFYLIQNIPKRVAASMFCISVKSVYRALKEKGQVILQSKYIKKKDKEEKKKWRLNESDVDVANCAINDLCPMQSGKNYRLRRLTYSTIFKKYCARIFNSRYLSFSTLYQMVRMDKQRTSKDQMICELCKNYEKLKNIFLL